MHGGAPHPPVFDEVFILKRVKVVCFDTLSQVLILKGLILHQNCASRRRRGPPVTTVRGTASWASPGTETRKVTDMVHRESFGGQAEGSC